MAYDFSSLLLLAHSQISQPASDIAHTSTLLLKYLPILAALTTEQLPVTHHKQSLSMPPSPNFLNISFPRPYCLRLSYETLSFIWFESSPVSNLKA